MKYILVCNMGESQSVKDKIDDLGITIIKHDDENDRIEIETSSGREIVSEITGVVSIKAAGQTFPWS